MAKALTGLLHRIEQASDSRCGRLAVAPDDGIPLRKGALRPPVRWRLSRAFSVALKDTEAVIPSIEDLLAAPIGVALLDRLEAKSRHEPFRPFDAFPDSKVLAVRDAAEQVRAMSSGEILSLALDAAGYIAGPWSPGAPESLAHAYALAPARATIAEALWERFADDLVRPLDLANQQCWLAETGGREPARFRDFTRVYGNGEFPWDGFWTVTDPPPGIHDDLILAWEISPGPITRWHLPVRPDARLWTIDHPSDWVRLVESYPKVASGDHAGWELAGPNQHPAEIRALCAAESQHAVRAEPSRHVLPDWRAVAGDYDGVHLSWSGFLTTEGFVCDLEGGGVTMLRYWGSERTLWLHDVFGSPDPLTKPDLSGRINEIVGRDADSDEVRTMKDLRWMAEALGRSLPG